MSPERKPSPGGGHGRFRHVVVYGAGAVGSYLSARLAPLIPVTLVARKAHVDAINVRGLSVRGEVELFAPSGSVRAVTQLDAIESATLVLVTVKLGDLEAAGAELAGLARTDTVFLLAQNGLHGRELFLRGAEMALTVVRAIASCGVDLTRPGEVEFWGGGLSFECTPKSAEVMALFAKAGVASVASPDFEKALWKKLAVNCVANPLTALLGRRNLEVIVPELAGLRTRIVREVATLAAAEGHPLPGDLPERVDQALASSRNRSSMLQDLKRGRRTEIDRLNGFVDARSRELGLAAPANAVLAALISALAAEPQRHKDTK